MAYPRFRRARAHKHTRRTTGTVNFSSTSFANFDTATDIVLRAAVGDVIAVHLGFIWTNGADYGQLDVFTIVSGSPVNGVGSGSGIAGVAGEISVETSVGCTVHYTLVSGDISSGTVTLRVRGKTTSGGVNKGILASATVPFDFAAENIGPVAS